MIETNISILCGKLSEATENAKQEAVRFINAILDENGGKFDFRDWLYDCGGSYAFTYDGGRHPEYASNAFSDVLGIGRDSRGYLTFDLDDEDEVDITRCDPQEVAYFADWLRENYESMKNYSKE